MNLFWFFFFSLIEKSYSDSDDRFFLLDPGLSDRELKGRGFSRGKMLAFLRFNRSHRPKNLGSFNLKRRNQDGTLNGNFIRSCTLFLLFGLIIVAVFYLGSIPFLVSGIADKGNPLFWPLTSLVGLFVFSGILGC